MGVNTGHQERSREFFSDVNSMLIKEQWIQPLAADADYLKNDQATNSASTTSITTFLNSGTPDFPRNVTLIPGGTTNDVAACTVSITGTNIRDEVITEDIAFAANATTSIGTTKAFKTVTQVDIPPQDGDSATFDIGIGDILGLRKKLQYNSIGGNAAVGTSAAALTREGTPPTVTASTGSIESNTIDFNTALAPTKTYVCHYFTDDPFVN